jgi:hypothetical protein
MTICLHSIWRSQRDVGLLQYQNLSTFCCAKQKSRLSFRDEKLDRRKCATAPGIAAARYARICNQNGFPGWKKIFYLNRP